MLDDYPGVTVSLKRLTFSAPFKPFVHRWAALTAALTSPAYDAATLSHVRLLHGILSAELADTIAAVRDYNLHKGDNLRPHLDHLPALERPPGHALR